MAYRMQLVSCRSNVSEAIVDELGKLEWHPRMDSDDWKRPKTVHHRFPTPSQKETL